MSDPMDAQRPVWPATVPALTMSPEHPAELPPFRRRSTWLGAVSIALAVASAALVAGGVVLAISSSFLVATILSFGAIALSAAAVVVGIVAVVGRFGRASGAVGIVLGILANPLVLVAVLSALGG